MLERIYIHMDNSRIFYAIPFYIKDEFIDYSENHSELDTVEEFKHFIIEDINLSEIYILIK